MDMNQDNFAQRDGQFPSIKPLRPHKQTSQASTPEQYQNNRIEDEIYTEHPPRTSSRGHPTFNSEPQLNRRTRAIITSVHSSLQSSSSRDNQNSRTLGDHSPIVRSIQSAASTHDTINKPVGVMGDFVPVDATEMPSNLGHAHALGQGRNISIDRSQTPRKANDEVHNPYEFEPPTPYGIDTRRTQFVEPITTRSLIDRRVKRSLHTKNSRSEDISSYTPHDAELDSFRAPIRPGARTIHRSESSPSLQQQPVLQPLTYLPRHNKTPSTDLRAQHSVSHGFEGGLDREKLMGGPRNTLSDGETAQSHLYRPSQEHVFTSCSESPTRGSRQGSLSSSYAPHGSVSRSPTKPLYDVTEKEESDSVFLGYPLDSPKPRSRSPMKKMFGEKGWLSQSPNENANQYAGVKNFNFSRKDGSSHSHQKKKSMMGKIKTKLEEFAEKAELTPPRSRTERERAPKLSMLSVSLGPPEQARIYMELELMLVHTANCFLMVQFSQGRIAVDSIKKTVDVWKNKGRPIVIEFMYDQATQRELIAANQHNFRFHGGRASDEIRINSMLYNWKQVANLMSIRTFCTADTVLLKLMFDIEQILELLGAGEPMLLRLQQIRASSNEIMRVTRHHKEVEANAQSIPRGRQMPWKPRSSTETNSLNGSSDEYGGLKLVPDSYQE